jgi:hypothetical protein
MSEQKLLDLGAETVCGDLILDRKTVGNYRNGAFLITQCGIDLVAAAQASESNVVEEVETVVRVTPRTAKKGKAVELVVEVPAGDELDLSELDAALGT